MPKAWFESSLRIAALVAVAAVMAACGRSPSGPPGKPPAASTPVEHAPEMAAAPITSLTDSTDDPGSPRPPDQSGIF